MTTQFQLMDLQTYQFQMIMYSNEVEGETLTFQYYDQSENSVYYLSETMELTSNMVIGNVVGPYIFTFNPGDGGNDCPSGIYDCAGVCDGDAVEDCIG